MNREDKLPEVGKYNAGQKTAVLGAGGCLILLLLTGIVIWRPYFAPAFNVTVIRIAVVAARIQRLHSDPRHHHPRLCRDLGQGQHPRDDARLRDARLGQEASCGVV